MNSRKPSNVQRLVVFVGGFDPRGARYYHQMCVRQAALQGAVDERHYAVSARQALDIASPDGGSHRHACWQVSDTQAATCEYLFFDWSGQVRSHWPRSIWAVLATAMKTYWSVWRARSTLVHLRAELPNTLLSFVYPLVVILTGMLLAMLCGWGTAVGARLWLEVGGLTQWLCAAATTMLMLSTWSAIDRRMHMSWLLRIFNFSHACARSKELLYDDRVQALAQWIFRRQQLNPELEVVVLGFSVGSVKALALLRAWQQVKSSAVLNVVVEGNGGTLLKHKKEAASVTLLTLGNCIPLFTLMPDAVHVRELLHSVGSDAHIYWADISSPGDSVSFAMCDLQRLALPGGTQGRDFVNPRCMCSPRFHMLFTPRRYRRFRHNKMRMHFQYLMASQLRGVYNFYSMLTTTVAVRVFVEKNLKR